VPDQNEKSGSLLAAEQIVGEDVQVSLLVGCDLLEVVPGRLL